MIIHITTDNQAEADAAFEQLIVGFSRHKDLAKSIWQIAKQYNSKGNRKKALELHQYNVANFSKDQYAMLSQVEIIKSYISDGNGTAAAAATDELINKFSDQPTLPQEIYLIARVFSQEKQEAKATKLDKYIIEKFPTSIYALFSQAYFSIKNSDFDAANATVDKILNDFKDDPILPKEIYQLARKYEALEKYDEAFQLYQHEVEHFPADDINTMWSLTGIIKCHIRNDNDTAADAAYNKLLSTYSKEPNLPEQIHYVARKYEEFEKYDKAIRLYQYNVESLADPTFAMRSQVRTVRCHISAGNEVDAEASIEKLINLFSNRPELPNEVNKIADQLAEAGYNDKAYKLYQYVINTWSDVNDLETHKYIAISNIVHGDEAAVINTIDNMLIKFKDDPKLAQTIFKIGERYWNMAIAEAKKMDAASDPNKAVPLNRPGVLNDKEREYFLKALAVWKKEYEQLPLSRYTKDAWFFSGACYSREMLEFQKAIPYYLKVVDEWPDYEHAWSAQIMIGDCYEKLRNREKISASEANPKIEQAFNAFIEKFPNHRLAEYAYRKLGKMYYQQARWEQAASCLQRYLEKYPQNKYWLNALFYLGNTYEGMGQSDIATELYKTYLEIAAPDDIRVRAIQTRLEQSQKGAEK